MLQIVVFFLISFFIYFDLSYAETIEVNIKGVDDGVKSSVQRDYREAILFAKREAIERAGVKIKSRTMIKDFTLYEDYIESQAEAVLLPGYQIVDIGYTANGTYQIVLIGKVTVEDSTIKQKPYTSSIIAKDGLYRLC
ncbi:MAG: hypothetical protein H8D67_30380 [Deltaproteobacteria bacterium]|nr:hypothetical protein [Deltaproteobacteria bacterium]MBL7203845.1 hypothetical protein [Desulfobacteraceae bacterium]